jgi:exopolysaccharide/PEP-CTERM locus tyrosine autokinase
MSIIERAVAKFEKSPQSASVATQAGGLLESLVEAASFRRRAPRLSATAAAAPPYAPAARVKAGPAPPARERISESGKTSRLIEINLARLMQAGMITPDNAKSQTAEEFRMIKRPLLQNALAQGESAIENGNLIMLTSALPKEGKTHCAINLAMSIAMEMDYRVLLVDADVARPSMPERLGFDGGRGLMDVLLDNKIDLADVMLRTNVEKLTLLPAGRGHRYATEILASEAMSRMIAELARRYRDRIIIFDSPPLLVTTEARVLASHMGQVVIVVEAGKTTQESLKEAMQHVDGIPFVGTVFNKGDPQSAGYYGRYFGYGS